eukprot:1223093-Rhodomonas_salina.2
MILSLIGSGVTQSGAVGHGCKEFAAERITQTRSRCPHHHPRDYPSPPLPNRARQNGQENSSVCSLGVDAFKARIGFTHCQSPMMHGIRSGLFVPTCHRAGPTKAKKEEVH